MQIRQYSIQRGLLIQQKRNFHFQGIPYNVLKTTHHMQFYK